MTFKTALIAVALVIGFFTFLSVTWDISAWMLQDSAPVAEKQPGKIQPAETVEGNTAATDQKADAEKIETSEPQEDETGLSGSYDDRWTGEPPAKTETGLAKTPPVNAATGQTSGSQNSGSEKSVTVPFPSDDRENVEPETDAGASGYSEQSGDPYKPDERETN